MCVCDVSNSYIPCPASPFSLTSSLCIPALETIWQSNISTLFKAEHPLKETKSLQSQTNQPTNKQQKSSSVAMATDLSSSSEWSVMSGQLSSSNTCSVSVIVAPLNRCLIPVSVILSQWESTCVCECLCVCVHVWQSQVEIKYYSFPFVHVFWASSHHNSAYIER